MLFTIPGSIHDGRREGRDGERASPTWRAPQLRRSHADGRTDGRAEGRGIKRLSNVSHITESRECHPERGQSTFERIPGRPWSEPGSGESPVASLASPSPAARPGVPRERIFGEPVFPGVQILDRGHWVPQRLPEAGRRHHARAPPRCVGGEGSLFYRSASVLVASDLAAFVKEAHSITSI